MKQISKICTIIHIEYLQVTNTDSESKSQCVYILLLICKTTDVPKQAAKYLAQEQTYGLGYKDARSLDATLFPSSFIYPADQVEQSS